MTSPFKYLHEVSVAGRPCDLFEPSAGSSPQIAAIYLHNADETRLRDQPELIALCKRLGLTVVAPRTGRSWWSDRVCLAFDEQLTTERHLLDNLLPFIKQRWGTEPPKVGLFGAEMGGQGVLRFAFKYPRIFQVVAAVSPTIDYQFLFDDEMQLKAMYRDREAARQDTALLHVQPLNWPLHQFFCCNPTDYPWWDGADRLHMKLASTGIPHEFDLETTANGHDEYDQQMMQRAVSFLVERLGRV